MAGQTRVVGKERTGVDDDFVPGVGQAAIGDTKFAAECQKKGDWCEEHDRAKSQCFKCDPKLKEKFAAQYRAKYGKEPPPIEDEEKKDDKKEGEKG